MTTSTTAASPTWRERYSVHPCADAFPMLSDDDLDQLAEDIKHNGLRDRIVFWDHGKNPKQIVGQYAIGGTVSEDCLLLDGRNRLAALERLGKHLHVGQFELLEHNVDPVAYVISKNIRRRHLTKEQQAELIVKTIEAGAVKNDRATVARSFSPATGKKGGSTKDPVLAKSVTEAAKHGISKRTVQNARAKLNGKTPAPRKKIGVSSAPPTSEAMPLGGRNLKVEIKWPPRTQAPQDIAPAATAVSHLDVHFSSESDEHLTPPAIIDAAVAVLQRIELDPCSNDRNKPNVPAQRVFTKADDGLSKVWTGRVYLNPPYGREIEKWVAHLVQDYRRTNGISAAIALVPARPDTEWWQRLADFPCCFIKGRLTFGGNSDPAPFPSAVFYLGKDATAFSRRFAAFGDIWKRTAKMTGVA